MKSMHAQWNLLRLTKKINKRKMLKVFLVLNSLYYQVRANFKYSKLLARGLHTKGIDFYHPAVIYRVQTAFAKMNADVMAMNLSWETTMNIEKL
jgi:hypothetical protein